MKKTKRNSNNAPATGVRICPSCEAQITDPAAVSCAQCGAEIALVADPDLVQFAEYLCPHCGTDTHGAKFCPMCGTNQQLANKKGKPAKKKLEKEMKRIAGEQLATCTNDLAGFTYLFKNGVAESTEGVFSLSCEFGDISYENERQDTKDDIFDKFSQLHGFFPPESSFQMNLINFPIRSRRIERYLDEVGPTADMAHAYNQIIEERQRRGRMEFDRRNFITFAQNAEDEAAATVSLAAMANGVKTQCARMNVKCEELPGIDRIHVLHDLARGTHEPMLFDYERLRKTKREHVRDYVAPAWAVYAERERFLRREITMPGRIVKVFHIKDFGSDLSDRAIRTIRALPIPMNISLTFRVQPRGKMVQRIRQNIDVVQAEMFDYSAAVGKSGGDPTLLPPALEDKEAEGRELLDFVREEDQMISWFQGLIAVFAESEEKMASYERMLMDEKGTWSIDITELPLQQEQAFISSLPLATPRLSDKYRSLSTAEGAAMVPFCSQNIHDDPKTSYLLGVDAVSNDSILVNPDKLKSPHMWLFGMTGSGKGMEVNSFLSYAMLQHPCSVLDEVTGKWKSSNPTDPQWHVFDFHEEYVEEGKRFGASINYFGPGHDSCLNPMDMSNAAGELTIKDMRANTDFFLALLESMMNRPLAQREKSLLDRCLNTTYEPFIGTSNRPTLTDLYAALRAEALMRKEQSPNADNVAELLADSLEMYVSGSMNSFAGQTNVTTSPSLNIYVMSELGQTMQTLGMMSSLQHVRQCTYRNYAIGKPTYLLIEECQILFDNDAAVRVLDSYFSELRKWGLHIICVTQLPNRVLNHPRAVNLFENSGLFVFLPQQQNNADTITDMFKLSKSQSELISQSADAGTGLVIADGVKVAMRNTIPKDNMLYDIWNTDPYKQAKLKSAPNPDAGSAA